ncbi:MAG: TetR/AcrR family transcriptional regulator [Desulfotomaculaceae bacterium]|nr:TetR/AcrR family transcriptional regulator [Desulfotomaculaceae bacterium]
MEGNARKVPLNRNRREQRSEESRARILAAATTIFAEKGPDGARVDEIAKASGINKRMIYAYFGNKEELYAEVLRSNYNKIYALSTKAVDLKRTPKENVTRAVRAYFYFLAENEAFVRLSSWEALNGGRFSRKVLPSFVDLLVLAFDDIVKDGIQRKFIRPNIDIRQVLFSIQALCLTYFNRRELMQPLWQEDLLSGEMLEARLQHILDLITDGIFYHGEAVE